MDVEASSVDDDVPRASSVEPMASAMVEPCHRADVEPCAMSRASPKHPHMEEASYAVADTGAIITSSVVARPTSHDGPPARGPRPSTRVPARRQGVRRPRYAPTPVTTHKLNT